MNNAGLRVIKLGGSLLAWDELPTAFHRWLAAQSPAADVVVVGGGPFVDTLRGLDRTHGLSEATSHWLAIRLMGVMSAIAAELLDGTRVSTIAEIQTVSPGRLQILDAEQFLRSEQDSDDALPCSWQVTSDSIAARVAARLAAAELVLLKSTLPTEASLAAATRSGYVDDHFASCAAGLAVRCVNLRDQDFTQCTLNLEPSAGNAQRPPILNRQ